MKHFYVTLENFPADSGDVVSKYGEIIGTYTCDDNDYLEFLPNGADDCLISGFFVGAFCSDIAKWHEGNEMSD